MYERWWISNFNRNEFTGGAELLGEQFCKAAKLKYMSASKFGIKFSNDFYSMAEEIDNRISGIELDVLFFNSLNCWSRKPNAAKKIAVCCENFKTESECMSIDDSFTTEKKLQWDRQKMSLANADKIVALSEMEKENFKDLGYDTVRIEPYINLETFKPGESSLRRILGIKDDMLLALYVGRNHSRKGFDIMSDLMNRRKDVFFLCIGAGSMLSDNFVGYNNVSENFLVDCYRACDFLIMPTRYESFGYVFAEAMACGKPILSTQTGLMADRDFWDCGVTTTETTYKSFSDLIDFFKLVGNQHDSGRSREIAEQRFSYERFRRDVDDLLSNW